MSNTTVLLSDLSFNGIKSSLITFLRAQPNLQDYDFEASNLRTLIDLLAYNTQQNGYMLNMTFNDRFMDTAELYDSVASHAKELSYTPRSTKSSSATLTVTIVPHDNPTFITIPANTTFSATAPNTSFVFRTIDPYIAYAANGYVVSNVIVYEGPQFTEQYTINYNDTTQQFIVRNANVDIDSIRVTITNGTTNTTYTRATSLLDFDANSTIFFVEYLFDQKYQIKFGDDTVGKRPENGAQLSISYRVPNGEDANKIFRFTPSVISGYANVIANTTSNSEGGAARETIESIKYYAPRFFQTRERAVTTNDYETLLQINFPEIRAINVFGGETMNPPQFGKVAIAIDLEDADGVSEGRKAIYYDFLRKRNTVSIEPIFVDPDFLNVKVNCIVNYNPAISLLSSSQIIANVVNTISTFNDDNLEDFGVTLFLSRLMEAINDTDTSIRSNQTTLTLERTLEVEDEASTYVTSFFNNIVPESLSSTPFTFNNTECFFGDDGEGSIKVFTLINGVESILNGNAGVINYDTGAISINSIDIFALGSILRLTITPANQDVATLQNTILQIDMNNVSVTTTS